MHCERKQPSGRKETDRCDGIDQTLPLHRSSGNRFDRLVHGKSNVFVETLDNRPQARGLPADYKKTQKKVPRMAEQGLGIRNTHGAKAPTRARQWGLTRAGLHQ